VEKGKIVISYPDKGDGWLDLPLKPKGTKARSHEGKSMFAIRVSQ
jgi:hypothetical protein